MDNAMIARTAKRLAREGFKAHFGKAGFKVPKGNHWKPLREAGTRLWLDTGDIDQAKQLWNDCFSALTTNNTLLNKEIQKGIYDEKIGVWAREFREADPAITDQRLVLEIAFVLNAYHALRLVELFDANVSVELHTALANDVDATVEYGKRYYEICPERFYVKVPLTPAGYISARRLGQAGIPINFTLGFSARQNYLAALLTRPTYVNVFMGRLNAFVKDNDLGDGQNVGEKATLSTQRELIRLRDAGRTESLLIGASMRNAEQAVDLAGLDVYTMPVKVAQEYVKAPPSELHNRVTDDPRVELNPDVVMNDFYGASLWLVSERFKETVDSLLTKDMSRLSPEALCGHFDQQGLGDFLPAWSDSQRAKVKEDGKIPVFSRWKEHLGDCRIGLDALMNISALYSFETDQDALDERIRGLL